MLHEAREQFVNQGLWEIGFYQQSREDVTSCLKIHEPVHVIKEQSSLISAKMVNPCLEMTRAQRLNIYQTYSKEKWDCIPGEKSPNININ